MLKAPTFRRQQSPAPMHRPRDEHGNLLRRDGHDGGDTRGGRGYGRRWKQARIGFIARHPLCVCCLANGVTSATELVDHVIPHRGDMALFWKRENWQGLCNWCHEHVKKVLEGRWDAGEIDAAELRVDRELTEFFG